MGTVNCAKVPYKAMYKYSDTIGNVVVWECYHIHYLTIKTVFGSERIQYGTANIACGSTGIVWP